LEGQVLNGKVLISAMVLLLISATCAPAALIIIGIQGVVDSVYDFGNNFEGAIQPDSIISGYYTYDSDTPDSTPDNPLKGTYLHSGPDYGMWLSIETFDFDALPKPSTLELSVLNDAPRYEFDPQPDDFYVVSYNSNTSPIYEDGDTVCRMSWQLGNYYGTAIESIHLPIMAPDISLWSDANYLTIKGGIYDSETGRLFDGYEINCHVTSAILIPEPCCALLILGGTILFRKRKTVVR